MTGTTNFQRPNLSCLSEAKDQHQQSRHQNLQQQQQQHQLQQAQRYNFDGNYLQQSQNQQQVAHLFT